MPVNPRIKETIKQHPFISAAIVIAIIAAAFFLFKKDPAAEPAKETNKNAGAKSGKGGKGKNSGPVPVIVSAAEKKDIPVFLNGLGTVSAYNTVIVRSQVDGQLVKLLFKEGDNVKAGQLLAKIDDRTYEAQLNQAIANKAKDEAVLENARADLKRYINLGDSISRQTVDTQRATVRQQEATLKSNQAAIDNAKTLLSYTNIKAPISGRTGLYQVDIGNIVQPGDTNGIVKITQLQPISVLFSLPQQNVVEINRQLGKQGRLVAFVTDADNKTTLDQGELNLVDNQIDPNTGTVKIKASFPNTSNLLWPGGFVNVWLLVDVRKDSVTVPTVAVQRGPQNNYVFVLKDDSSVEMRNVKIDFAHKDDSVIAEGLRAGERVVTEGAAKLENGTKVNVTDNPAAPGVNNEIKTEAKSPIAR